MKNAVLIIVGLFIVAIAVISCKKNAIQERPPVINSFSPQYDTLEGTVTIVGMGFTGATAVSFGGAAALSFKVISDDTITAIVGLGGTGNVSVTTAGGIGTRAGFQFPLIFCGCNSSEAVVPSYNLIAHWPFDGNANEAISNLGPLNEGGDTAYVKGRIGQAIRFTNGWLTYPAGATFAGVVNSVLNTNDTLQNGFTITLWAQINVANAGDTLIKNLFQLSGTDGTTPNWPLAGIAVKKFVNDSMFLFGGLTNRDSLGTHPSYDSAAFNGSVKDTLQWAFIALVYDSSSHSLQYYFNGNTSGNAFVGQSNLLMGSVSGSVFEQSSVLHLPAPNYATIGAFESKAIFPSSLDNLPLPTFMATGFTGVLDDIRVYNITLNAQNINDLYVLGGEGK
ncbi:MAG TPA: IPT/TIG domain-containing protein [Bacteroidia bacterium]|nr:IPT/TIG domain-containing protein [Bacteroidia bacterium]